MQNYKDYNNSSGRQNNAILILLIILVSLVLVVAVTGIVYMLKNPIDTQPPAVTVDPLVTTDAPDTDTPTSDPIVTTEAPTTDPVTDSRGITFIATPVASKQIYMGDLILVNGDHPFDFSVNTAISSSVTDLYPIWKDWPLYNYKVMNSSLKTTKRGAELINPMFDAFLKETAADLGADLSNNDSISKIGINDYMITSFYRDYAEQEATLEEMIIEYGSESAARRYCALPGHSEHHTGLAFDCKVYTDDGVSYKLGDEKTPVLYNWIYDNCARFGFIHRYQAGKEAITGTAAESWHFRYVGVPHAGVIKEKGFCLEEYIDFIKAYTYDNYLVVETDTVTYAIYYVEAETETVVIPEVKDENGNVITPAGVTEQIPDTVSVYLPTGNVPYEISGNNVDGFIITMVID